uniref:HTH CENPB-type domain-containing protein n=1 Tax=Daphnia galeata TaxID=27404 RepID=A0A8J2R9N3_9CRUS|nr:unnamed protein product [Daphnia galeata]
MGDEKLLKRKKLSYAEKIQLKTIVRPLTVASPTVQLATTCDESRLATCDESRLASCATPTASTFIHQSSTTTAKSNFQLRCANNSLSLEDKIKKQKTINPLTLAEKIQVIESRKTLNTNEYLKEYEGKELDLNSNIRALSDAMIQQEARKINPKFCASPNWLKLFKLKHNIFTTYQSEDNSSDDVSIEERLPSSQMGIPWADSDTRLSDSQLTDIFNQPQSTTTLMLPCLNNIKNLADIDITKGGLVPSKLTFCRFNEILFEPLQVKVPFDSSEVNLSEDDEDLIGWFCVDEICSYAAEKLAIVTQKLAKFNRLHDGLPPMPPCNGCYPFYCPCEVEPHIDECCRQCEDYWFKIHTCLNSETDKLQGDYKSLTSLENFPIFWVIGDSNVQNSNLGGILQKIFRTNLQ